MACILNIGEGMRVETFRAVELLLTRYFWIINVIMITCAAYFLAGGAGELIVMEISERLPNGADAPQPRVLRRPLRRETHKVATGTAILERNIFDSAEGPIDPDHQEPDETETTLPSGPVELTVCEADALKLLSTVVSDAEPRWSFASLKDGTETRLLRIGDSIGERVVADITWRYLLLEGVSSYCYLDLFSENNLSKGRGKKSRRNRGRSLKNRLKNRIQKLGKNERIVKRGLLKEVMADPSKFTKGLRFRPKKERGKVVGYSISRMSKNSPLGLLGLRKSDVVTAVNGKPMTNMNTMLGFYSKLGATREVRLSIKRRGKPITLKVRVR